MKVATPKVKAERLDRAHTLPEKGLSWVYRDYAGRPRCAFCDAFIQSIYNGEVCYNCRRFLINFHRVH